MKTSDSFSDALQHAPTLWWRAVSICLIGRLQHHWLHSIISWRAMRKSVILSRSPHYPTLFSVKWLFLFFFLQCATSMTGDYYTFWGKCTISNASPHRQLSISCVIKPYPKQGIRPRFPLHIFQWNASAATKEIYHSRTHFFLQTPECFMLCTAF